MLNRRNPCAGATLVETAFAAVMTLAITGALIDIGVGLQRYGTITEGVLVAARRLANLPCTSVLPSSGRLPERRRSLEASDPLSMINQVRSVVASETGNADNLVRFEILDSGFACDANKFSPALSQTQHPILQVKAWVKLPCLSCLLFGGLEVPISTRIPVEDTGPMCGYPVTVCP
jgi:hypothetical protein